MIKKAVILVNLGTPDEPTPKAVGGFLKAFLSDSRVVEAPKILWWFLLRLVIIPLRKKKVANNYREIWWQNGSPLRVITDRQVEGLTNKLSASLGDEAPLVASAMTYGAPSIKATISELQQQGVEQFLVLPLYPQYSGSTTGAIYDQLAEITRKSRNVPDIAVVKSFHENRGYIDSLARLVRDSWEKNGRSEKLLMSFHGIPKDYVKKGDPYYDHCSATARALAATLGLNATDWVMSFQSRFGPKQWLQPYTDTQLKDWACSGIKSVDVISPAFTADCLETLEELDKSYRSLFIAAGGEKYCYIPCVNDSDDFLETLFSIVLERFLPVHTSKIGNLFK